jgi:outer membrane protein OmpA-like peptidoglycan-associated protein
MSEISDLKESVAELPVAKKKNVLFELEKYDLKQLERANNLGNLAKRTQSKI